VEWIGERLVEGFLGCKLANREKRLESVVTMWNVKIIRSNMKAMIMNRVLKTVDETCGESKPARGLFMSYSSTDYWLLEPSERLSRTLQNNQDHRKPYKTDKTITGTIENPTRQSRPSVGPLRTLQDSQDHQ
jgi:hypothetical protein